MLAGMHPSPCLQPWRLKLAYAYVEAHLSGSVPLAELSRAAGFTDMHFARLFRASTGVSPHNYVLRRRIDAAQAALMNPNHAMLDVALLVGFRTQAHFSAVFKKLTGLPPRRWRQASLAARRADVAGLP
jgi:AraC family transcriptional regulator